MISAIYTSAENTSAAVTLEPGDHLASINVQAPATIPAYTIPAHTVPAFEIDGVGYPERKVPAEDVEAVEIPGGQTTVYTVPCRDDNPVWVALLAGIEAGEIEAIADFVPPPPGPTVVAKFDFWDRLTEGEAEQVEQVISQQTVKNRRAFETAQTFRSDSPLWALLVQLAEGLFGKPRAAEILAPSA